MQNKFLPPVIPTAATAAAYAVKAWEQIEKIDDLCLFQIALDLAITINERAYLVTPELRRPRVVDYCGITFTVTYGDDSKLAEVAFCGNPIFQMWDFRAENPGEEYDGDSWLELVDARDGQNETLTFLPDSIGRETVRHLRK